MCDMSGSRFQIGDRVRHRGSGANRNIEYEVIDEPKLSDASVFYRLRPIGGGKPAHQYECLLERIAPAWPTGHAADLAALFLT